MTGLQLEGKVAFVTGAASGIGKASALALGEAGARLALIDRSEDLLADVATELAGRGIEARHYPFDLLNLSGIEGLVASVIGDFGHIDCLVNAAGIANTDTILTVTLETWERVHTINLRAPMLLIQAVGKHMIERGEGGKIVNLSSSSAYRADLTCFPAYSSSKAGIDALTRSAAAVLGPHNINVNSVVPGVTITPMVGNIDPQYAVSGPLANLLQRLSMPEDVANIVAFLCSPLARQITAQSIHSSAGNIV
jgi:NAD(P)-dependent dehydrogenase (short-subunit alcohol dehydrogenase family)